MLKNSSISSAAWRDSNLPAVVLSSQPSVPLKMHGGVAKADLATENVQAVIDGLPNLDKHLANIQEVYGLPVVVAINKFPLDTEAELEAVYESCKKRHVDVVISDVWAKGGAGGRDLAEKSHSTDSRRKPLLLCL